MKHSGPKAQLHHWIGIRKNWEKTSMNLTEAMVSLPPSQLKTHALIIGATGSGKTNLLHHMIAQDVLLGHSFAVLDMRGDLVSAALEICSDHVSPSKVALYDLREKTRPLGFNPLHGAGEAYFRALGVLDVIAAEAESWGVQLAETLRNAVMLLAETSGSIVSLESIFFDAGFRSRSIRECPNESVRSFWERYSTLSPDKQSALALPVLNKVSLLTSTSALMRTLGNPQPFDIGSHLNSPGSVTLVSLAVDELHGAGRMMGNLMLSSITREIFSRVNTPEASRNPVRLYVDEFENFSTKEFEKILAEGRRFGLSLVIAHQTLAQLTPRIRSMILNNVGTKIVFRSGREDGSTLSKDLTGDGKLLNVCALPVGEAILWTRESGITHVEISSPLLRNVGTRSESAKRFIGAIRDLIPPCEEPRGTMLPVAGMGTAKPYQRKPQSVEDWL